MIYDTNTRIRRSSLILHTWMVKSVKGVLTNKTTDSVFPSQMCCVNYINNQVIIWLIIQKQHLRAALFSKYNTTPPTPKHPGPKRSLQKLAWFTVVMQLTYTLTHTHIHTQKHTFTNTHTHTHIRYWTSVSLLSKGNMSALSSRSRVSSPRLSFLCFIEILALLASPHSIPNILIFP